MRRLRRASSSFGWAESLPFGDGEFDRLTFTYLLRCRGPGGDAGRAGARGEAGRVAGLLADPPLWRPLWRLYTRALLPAAGFALGGREWWSVGRFLGPSIEALYGRWPIERQLELWRGAGVGESARGG